MDINFVGNRLIKKKLCQFKVLASFALGGISSQIGLVCSAKEHVGGPGMRGVPNGTPCVMG